MQARESVAGFAVALGMPSMQPSGIGDGRDDLPQDTKVAAVVVSGDVVGNGSEEWGECLGPTTGLGSGHLPNRMDLASQVAAGDGETWPG